MQHDEFIGKVQAAARLPSRGDAEKATRVTPDTLGERLAGGEPSNLAAQLPEEIGRYLEGREGTAERFGLDDFFKRVSERGRRRIYRMLFTRRARWWRYLARR